MGGAVSSLNGFTARRAGALKALAAGAVALALGACANTTDPEIRNTASYQQGYSDGCTTGNQRVEGFSSTITRNKTLFETDEAYQIGWKQGYSVCGGSQVERRDRRNDVLFEDRFDQGPI